MALKSVLVSFLIMILFVSESYAFCYQKVMSAARRVPNLGCYDTVPAYTPSTGCSVSSSAMQGCLAVYQICCDESVTSYSTGGPHVDVITGVDQGSEYEAARQFYEDMQGYGYAAPACQEGFRSTWEGNGMVHKSESDPNDFTKSKVTVSTFYQQGCESFSNNTTTGSYTPIGSVGGTGGAGGTVTVDMTATNTLLTEIKAAIEAGGGSGGGSTDMAATNTLLTEIKAAIVAAGGSGGGSTDMTATNDLLTVIKNGVEAGNVDGAVTNDLLIMIKDSLVGVSGGSTDMTTTNGLLGQILNKLGSTSCVFDPILRKDVCTNTSMVVNDPGSLALLNQIKDLLAAGGSGGGSTDMTATNNLLTESKGILGSIKDKIDSLYESITGFFNTGGDSGSVDALSTAGVPTEGDLTGGDLETRMRSQLKEKFEFEGKKTALDIYKEHQTEWGKSDLFGFINNLNVQMGASLPVWNLSLPRWGVNYTFDLGDSHWSYIFGVVRTLIIIGATIMAYRIIFRAGA